MFPETEKESEDMIPMLSRRKEMARLRSHPLPKQKSRRQSALSGKGSILSAERG